jgi:hypothetical protein
MSIQVHNIIEKSDDIRVAGQYDAVTILVSTHRLTPKRFRSE